jgi:hypothetical protein
MIRLSAREVHILVQALRISIENGEIIEYAKPRELEQLRTKLGNVK